MTKTFALIDNASGYVWGVTTAEDPISACRAIDESCKEYGRSYEEVSRINRSGYIVYAVPAGFAVEDGQSERDITRVEGYPVFARVETKVAE